MSDLTKMTPIVYQDVMRVIIAGTLGNPTVGVNHANGGDGMLVMTIAEAHELAMALVWALDEYDERMGMGSFYPGRYPKRWQDKRQGRNG